MDKEVLQIEQQLKSTIALLQDLKKKQEGQVDQPDSSDLKTYELQKSEFIEKIQSELVQSKNAMVNQLKTLINEFDKKYDSLTDDIVTDLHKNEKVQEGKVINRIFCQKVHKTRTSLLIKMYQNEDARTVYHIFIATMLVMILGEMLNTYFSHGVIIDLSLFSYVFGNVTPIVLFWLLMAFSCFLIVPFVGFIHKNQLLWINWIGFYAIYQLLFYTIPCAFCLYYKIPIASGFVITLEMVRMSLKMHSYLREKLLFGNGENEYAKFIPESLIKKGVTLDYLAIPTITIEDVNTELNRFLYFFFAPTLIYRDSYPRIQSSRRYDMILVNLLNVMGTILYTFIIFQSTCVPYFMETWKNEYNFQFVLISWFKAMIPATMLLVLMFFGLLHSWFNLWAELLRFGDREFYTDWWNVTNFAEYYRKWNIVVHEWLFHYVYQDMLRFTRGKSSQLACFFAVFIISAVIHELVLAISMQFFYPILLVMFGGPGVIYTFFSRKETRVLNIFVWSMFFVGNGILVVFYSWEYFARKNLDLSDKYGWKAFFIPHSWGIMNN